MHIGVFAGEQPGVEPQGEPHHQYQLEHKGLHGAGLQYPGNTHEINRGSANRHVERLESHNRGSDDAIIGDGLKGHGGNCVATGHNGHGYNGIGTPGSNSPKPRAAIGQRVIPGQEAAGKEQRQHEQNRENDPVASERSPVAEG